MDGVGLSVCWVAGAAVTSRRSHDARRENYVASPWSKQTTSLATTGSFRWSRNPMYLGLVTALVGWAAFLSAAWPLLGPVVFMLYVNRFQIRPEERVLTELFAAEYTKYTRRVRRWLKPALQAEGSRSREAGGMGLGLSIARNIARAPGGDVSIRNRPSGGLEPVLMQPR